jgi:amino acid transporter
VSKEFRNPLEELVMSVSRPSRSSPVASLAADRLGVAAVVFFVMSAATPLTVAAGVITTGYATTALTGIPLAFVLVGLVLALFSVGYVAMARHVANAGAFYSYIAQGLGRPAGVGGAWVALAAYNALQVGLYGAIGVAAQPLLAQWAGVSVPWWLIALVAWAMTAALGLLRVDVNGTVLAVLLIAEVAVILVYDLGDLTHPAGGHVAMTALAPGNLFGPGVGAVLVLAVLGFVGFEGAVVFSEESRDPRRTVPVATYLSVGLIAALYGLSAWAMTVAVGPDRIVQASQTDGPELIFHLAGADLGRVAVDLGHVLFVTSIMAALVSFHNTTARYMFALGREQVLPACLGRTSRRSGAPRNASLWQSGIGLMVIVVYAVAGWDPLVRLFFYAGTAGGLGVLFLITATSAAVVRFFARHRHGETVWRRAVAPTVATVALVVVVVLAVYNLGGLLGVPAGHPLAWAIPLAYLVAAVAGVGWGLVLRSRRPAVYATIGLGAKAATARLGLPTSRHPYLGPRWAAGRTSR